STENLSFAFLEWAGIKNETMQGSGMNWYRNKTFVPRGNYTFKVYANDSAGNWNVTVARWAHMNATNISVPHPSLLFTNISETPGYQHRTEEPWLGWEEGLIASAVSSLARNFSNQSWTMTIRMFVLADYALNLALAYQITENKTYAEKAKEALLNLDSGKAEYDMDRSDALRDYSFAYDWTQPYLDSTNDTIIRDKLANLTDTVYMDLNDNGTAMDWVSFSGYHGKAYPSVGVASLALYDYTNPNSLPLVSGPSDWLKVGTEYLFVDDKMHTYNRSMFSFRFDESGEYSIGTYKAYTIEHFVLWFQAYNHFLGRNIFVEYPIAKKGFTSELWDTMPNHYNSNYVTSGNVKYLYHKGLINLLDDEYKSYILNHLDSVEGSTLLPYSSEYLYVPTYLLYIVYGDYASVERKPPQWTSHFDTKSIRQVFRGSWLNDSDWLSFMTWNHTSDSNRDMLHHDQFSFEYYSRGDLLLADGGEDKYVLDKLYGDSEIHHNGIAIENPRSPFSSSTWADSAARGIFKGSTLTLTTPSQISQLLQLSWIEIVDANVTAGNVTSDTSTSVKEALSSPIEYSRTIIYPKDYFIVIDRMEGSETWTYRNIFRPTSLNITPTKQYTNTTDLDINATAGKTDAVHMVTPTSFDGKSAELLVTLKNVSASGNLSVYINSTYIGKINFTNGTAATSYYLRDIPSGNFTKGAANKINYSTTDDVSLVIDETEITIMGEVKVNLSIGNTYYDWLALQYKNETQTGISTNSVKWNTTNPYGNKVEAQLFSSPASEIFVTKHVGRIAGYNTASEVFNPVVYFRTGPASSMYRVTALLSRYSNESEKTPANLSVTGNGNAVKVSSTDYEDYIYSGSGSSTYATAATDADTAFNRYNLTSGKMQYIMLLNANYFTYGANEWLNSTQKIPLFLMNISGTNRTITADGVNGTNATIYVESGYTYQVKRNGVIYSNWNMPDSSHIQISMTFDSQTAYSIESTGESGTLSAALNAPVNNLLTNNATVTFNCSTTSANPLVNITLYANWSGWSQKNSTNITGTSNSSQWINTLADGSYIWNCLAYDNTGNSSFAAGNYTLIVDTTPPMSVTNLANQSSGTTWIYWNWTNPASDFNHTEIWLNGTFQQNISVNYFNATGLSANTWYQIQTRTADNAGNINATWVNSTAKTLSDVTPPTITILSPLNQSYAQKWVWANITLNEAGSWCGVSLNGTTNQTLSNTSTTAWYLNLTVPSEGSNNMKFYCNDTAGNMGNSSLVYFTIDTIKPTLTFVNITPNNNQTNNSWAFINITSSELLSSALLEWNGTAPNLTMQGSSTNFYYNKTAAVGNYTFKVYANDTANNWNVTETRWVYINYTSCTESWSYSDWSACSGGTQTRTATDANSCGTTVNQSALSQSCTSDTGGTGGGGGSSAPSLTKSMSVTPQEPLTKITINLKTRVYNPAISATKITAISVQAPSEPVYQYMNITKNNFNNSQIENATIDFKVNKSWILSNNFTRIWLARYDNGWNKLKTELLNSTATTNYYRAYADAFSYFAIIGEKAQTAQAAPPAVEQPKEPVKEETNAEQPKEPEAPAVEEQKAAPPYYAYFLA
ncbi:PGF-pre-PGF domain-containing protein, partial [archaeon]|nr:PGF-pre-PGF domain-containing protein [archaeon]